MYPRMGSPYFRATFGVTTLCILSVLPVRLCLAVQHGHEPRGAAVSTVAGVWRTEGYGIVVSIAGTSLTRYETTAISCIRNLKAILDSSNGGEFVFRGPDVNPDTGVQDVLTVRRSPRDQAVTLQIEGTVAPVRLVRQEQIPSNCDKNPDPGPGSVFETFWQTYAENYPFFALHRYDWDRVGALYRSEAQTARDPAQLFRILQKMIEPLQDAHTLIETNIKGLSFYGYRHASPAAPEEPPAGAPSPATLHANGAMAHFCNDKLQFVTLEGGLGYLRISAFEELSPDPTIEAQGRILAEALDEIFGHRKFPNGLIVDLRQNSGGSDVFAIQLAARLTNARYVAYSKIARDDPRQVRFTQGYPVVVQPSHRAKYLGPLVLLTGADTVSAAETFTMALMERKPRPIRVGDNTQGVFSDVLIRKLPNGWTFGLPNEEYLDRDGRSYDVYGIPPDIRVETPPAPRAVKQPNEVDLALEAAVKLLRHRD